MSETTFAARLRRLREAAGLSQADLADRAGMHRFGVAKLEQGLREPAWATVQALAKALGVTCLAFTDEASALPAVPEGERPTEPRSGRPRKAQPEAPPQSVKKPRGRSKGK
jgi:transcriptional regulator with XRE-family HTH domain